MLDLKHPKTNRVHCFFSWTVLGIELVDGLGGLVPKPGQPVYIWQCGSAFVGGPPVALAAKGYL